VMLGALPLTSVDITTARLTPPSPPHPIPIPIPIPPHPHTQIGIPIAHSLVHAVEASGVGIALVSTAAATLGEVIATRALLAAQREEERRRVDALAARAVEAIDSAGGLRRRRPHVMDPSAQVLEGGEGDGEGGEGAAQRLAEEEEGKLIDPLQRVQSSGKKDEL